MKYLTPAEVADLIQVPDDVKDPEGFVKRRCRRGEIKGKQISRGVYRITEDAVHEYMTRIASQPEKAPADPAPDPVVSIADGLSKRARRRVQTA